MRSLQSGPYSSAWLTDLNSPALHTIAPAGWQDLLRLRIGIPVGCGDPCLGCNGITDALGDHALACPACGRYARHNSLRNELLSECIRAGMQGSVEVSIPRPQEPPDPGGIALRPADIMIPTGPMGRPLAIDVTVLHPLRTSQNITARDAVPGSFCGPAEEAKVRKYGSACSQAGWGFVPFAMETTGGIGKPARGFLRTLATSQAAREGVTFATAYSGITARLRAAVVASMATSLALSIPTTRERSHVHA